MVFATMALPFRLYSIIKFHANNYIKVFLLKLKIRTGIICPFLINNVINQLQYNGQIIISPFVVWRVFSQFVLFVPF